MVADKRHYMSGSQKRKLSSESAKRLAQIDKFFNKLDTTELSDFAESQPKPAPSIGCAILRDAVYCEPCWFFSECNETKNWRNASIRDWQGKVSVKRLEVTKPVILICRLA